MSDKMNRRKFLKLTGTVVLATSVAGALGGCSGGGSSAPTPPSPEEEGIAQIILDSINAARKEVGLDGTVQEVDKISQLSAQRALEMMNGKKHDELSPVPQEFKDAERATVWWKGKLDSNAGLPHRREQRSTSESNFSAVRLFNRRRPEHRNKIRPQEKCPSRPLCLPKIQKSYKTFFILS